MILVERMNWNFANCFAVMVAMTINASLFVIMQADVFGDIKVYTSNLDFILFCDISVSLARNWIRISIINYCTLFVIEGLPGYSHTFCWCFKCIIINSNIVFAIIMIKSRFSTTSTSAEE